MNVSEVVLTGKPELRRVGVTFPNRLHVMQHAKHLYIDLGIACDIDPLGLSIPVPRVAAPWFAGLLERATGQPAFSEWDQP